MYSYIWKINRKNPISDINNLDSVSVKGVVPLLWREHCMECAMPLCYKSCNLYSKRMDGRCQRFKYGIENIRNDSNFGAKIYFKRWAKLESVLPKYFNAYELKSINKAFSFFQKIEYLVRRISNLVHWYRPCQIFAHFYEKYIQFLSLKNPLEVDGFYLKIYLHEKIKKKINIEILQKGLTVFKKSFVLNNEWNDIYIQISEFSSIKLGVIRIYFEPDEEAEVSIKFADFVSLKKDDIYIDSKPSDKIKCIAWDLDNTLWDGVIGDIGKKNVKIKNDSINLIHKLDEMGIIQTIVSKNTFSIAWSKIEELGLDEYFLYPAINWGRKSQSLINIAKELNINIDTFGFIDDSIFERKEVSENLPQVRVYDVTEIDDLLSRDEFNITITEESKNRRNSYLSEYNRKNISASWSGDYDTFLKSCNFKMNIFKPIQENDIQRCLELLSRSNQYNVSAKRLKEDDLFEILNNSQYDTFAFRVKDDYGDYGIVGFASFYKDEDIYYLTNFVMSCRVAQKKIERAFFKFIVDKISKNYFKRLNIKCIVTERNKPLRDELKNMPFSILTEDDNILDLSYDITSNIFINDEIVFIQES